MSGIKQQITEIRKTTPKHIQWILMVAAFIVVLVLLILLLGGSGKSSGVQKTADEAPIKLIVAATPPEDWTENTLTWTDVTVGTTKEIQLNVKATAPVKIKDVRYHDQIAGLDIKETCKKMAEINQVTGCNITLKYAPTVAMDSKTLALFIDWHDANQPEKMSTAEKLILVLSSVAPEIKQPAEPTPEPEPAPKPVQQEIKQQVETLAPADPFADNDHNNTKVADDTPSTPCSEFAFPGYDANGTQIGWIRPERGAYYFHPFSDKKCNNPTGVYNPDSGIITDIKTPGKKIGTDAEHIGYTDASADGALPQLSNPVTRVKNRAYQLTTDEIEQMSASATGGETADRFRGGITMRDNSDDVVIGTSGNAFYSSNPYDRTFVLRQYKPIPATIVSEVRADPSLYKDGAKSLPVRATVDRNVYSDNGRTVVIPAGTLLLGYVTGEIPGPYKTVGRMDIRWYQFVLPNGVEFNFTGNPNQDPFSGDSQGRAGVPGYGSTDYIEQMVLPLLTAVVPAAVNMIAPITDKFVNQIDLDNNTVVQSGTVRSSELAKNEIITAWNQVAQKFIVDMLDNTVPPFSIAAGTRITVFSPADLVITCGENDDKICSLKNVQEASKKGSWQKRPDWQHSGTVDYSDNSWTGQVRSFNLSTYCKNYKDGKLNLTQEQTEDLYTKGINYSTVLFYCQSGQYTAINNARQAAIYQNQQDANNSNSIASTGGVGTKSYNENVLGLKYNEDGSIQNPFQAAKKEEDTAQAVITCEDGTAPDANGCCTGEIYTDMGDQGFNCCPETGGDCFPPIL